MRRRGDDWARRGRSFEIDAVRMCSRLHTTCTQLCVSRTDERCRFVRSDGFTVGNGGGASDGSNDGVGVAPRDGGLCGPLPLHQRAGVMDNGAGFDGFYRKLGTMAMALVSADAAGGIVPGDSEL